MNLKSYSKSSEENDEEQYNHATINLSLRLFYDKSFYEGSRRIYEKTLSN